jgi:hypothetical protein
MQRASGPAAVGAPVTIPDPVIADAERLSDQSLDLILALLASSISREHIDVPAAKSSGSNPPWQCGQHTAILPHARSSSLVARTPRR